MNTTKIELHRMKRAGNREVWMMRWYGTDGKRYGETVGDVRKVTKREAMARLREKQSAMDGGKARRDKPGRMTLSTFKTYFREAHESEKRASTLCTIDTAFNHAIAELGGEIQLTAISERDANRIKSRMSKRGVSRTTIYNTIRTLRSAFKFAQQRNLIHANPFDTVKAKAKRKAKPARVFERAEIRELLDAAPDTFMLVWMKLAFTSGLRFAEMCHLRWSDVDFEGGYVRVQARDANTFTADGEAYPVFEWEPKSRAGTRTVPVPACTIAALQRLKLAADGSAYVFVRLDRLRELHSRQRAGTLHERQRLLRTPIERFQSLQRRVFGRDTKIGTLHDCRKTYCTHAAHELPMHVLKELAGHEDAATTATYYTVASESDHAKARAVFADAEAA